MNKRVGLALVALLTVLSQASFADELVIYGIAPISKIRWEMGPAYMAFDGVAAALGGKIKGQTHNVGHASIELNCEGSDGKPARHFNAGMTTVSSDGAERQLLFTDKVGMGVLLQGVPGRVETTEELREDIAPRLAKGERIHFLRFKISPENCRRMERYYDEFMARGYNNHYGFPSKPRQGQGAACTSFAYSFLEVGGLMAPEFKQNWMKQFRIPLHLIGGKVARKIFTDPADVKRINEKVHVLSLPDSTNAAKRWACEDEPGYTYTARDAQFFYDWIEGVIKGEIKPRAFQFQVDKIGQALGLTADVRDLSAPSEPLFLPLENVDMTVKGVASPTCAYNRKRAHESPH